jgi:crotonobetainyl-CoA:carnitine CoA-transferase CaiB-like acyl-CoA transferase
MRRRDLDNSTAVGAAAVLLEAGVPASTVLTFAALADDPHLAARGTFVEANRPVLEGQRLMRAPWKFSGWGDGVRAREPLLAADNGVGLPGAGSSSAWGLAASTRESFAPATLRSRSEALEATRPSA